MTPLEQRYRNEVGQLTHKVHRMLEQRVEMQADLIRQREDMANAIRAIQRGELREATEILQGAIQYRERVREPRKHA